jgi:hypothetical protein
MEHPPGTYIGKKARKNKSDGFRISDVPWHSNGGFIQKQYPCPECEDGTIFNSEKEREWFVCNVCDHAEQRKENKKP